VCVRARSSVRVHACVSEFCTSSVHHRRPMPQLVPMPDLPFRTHGNAVLRAVCHVRTSTPSSPTRSQARTVAKTANVPLQPSPSAFLSIYRLARHARFTISWYCFVDVMRWLLVVCVVPFNVSQGRRADEMSKLKPDNPQPNSPGWPQSTRNALVLLLCSLFLRSA
jgi:hypothetical protein